MKVISILLPTIDSGGAEKQAVLLATQLSKLFYVHLIILYGEHEEYKANSDLLNASPVHIHKLSGNLVVKLRYIKNILKSTGTSVLFNFLSLPDVIGSYVGHRIGIKVYNGIRTTRLEAKKEYFERYAHNHWATGTIYNCYSGAKYFEGKGFNKGENIVIPNCFPNIERPIHRQPKQLKTILTVGRFDAAKDYETVIKSISMLQRNDYRLCIVGYGALEEQIRSWIKEYGIEDRTDIHIKPDNISELERNADIYISTSLFEGTSNSIMEAMNWSLPVVATDVGDNNHLIIDGENGYLHPVGDVSGIVASLNRLLDSADLRNKMGVKGNLRLKENYSKEIFEKRYLELIEGE